MRDSQPLKRGIRAGQMVRVRMMVRKDARTAEKSGKHHVATGGVRGARSQQIRRNDSQQRTQLEYIPAFAPENRNRGSFACHGITLARNGLNQRGFAASIGSEDANVFAGTDAKRNAIERRPSGGLSAHDGDVVEGQEWRRRGHFGFMENGNYILNKRK